MRTRYRFVARIGRHYVWESVLPIGPRESRHERIVCGVDWFWGRR